MGSRATRFEPIPVFVSLSDGSRFVCQCRSSEFRRQVVEGGQGNLFCKCGRVYTPTDIAEITAPLEE